MRKPVIQDRPPQRRAAHQKMVTLGMRNGNPVQPIHNPLSRINSPVHHGLLTPPPMRAKQGKIIKVRSLFIDYKILAVS
jgi:hypothetical protein